MFVTSVHKVSSVLSQFSKILNQIFYAVHIATFVFVVF